MSILKNFASFFVSFMSSYLLQYVELVFLVALYFIQFSRMVWFSFWSFISFVRLRAAAGSRRRQAPGGGRLRAAGSGQRQAPGGGRLWAATGSGRQTLGGVLFIVGRYILALGHCKASFDFITLWNLFFFFSSLKY